MPGSGRKAVERYLLLSFALSGAAALIAQNVWQRELMRLVGATTPAAAVVYAGVMAGLGAGALLGNAILTRGGGLFEGINPFRFFALLEAVTCALAIAYAFIFSNGLLMQIPFLADETNRLALAFVMVALPSLSMGMTWPAAVSAAENVALDVDALSMGLYAANIFGAVAGAAFGAFYLIPKCGLSFSLCTAGGLNLVAGASAIVLSLAAVKLICPRNPIDIAASSAEDSVMPQFDCLLVFLSAACTLSLEVIFTRFFTLTLGSSVYSVAVVLIGVLIGMYISAHMGCISAVVAKKGTAVAALPAPSFSAKAACLAALIVFAEACLLNRLPDLVLYLSQLASSFNFRDLPLLRTFLVPRVFLCQWLVILPIALTSAIFPIVLKNSLKEVNSKIARAGWLYSASALGAVIGSLATGLYLIPTLGESYESGLLAGLIVVSGICLLIAALVASHHVSIAVHKDKSAGMVFLSSAAIIGLVATLYPPHADTFLLSQGLGFLPVENQIAADQLRASIEKERKNSSIIFYREGLNTTVTVQDMPGNNVRVLKNDGKVEAAIPRNLALSAPTSDYPTQILLACLPYVLSRQDKNNTLVIGCGSGATYGALAEQKNVSALTVAEIEKAVFEASRLFLLAEKKAERADIAKLVCDARSQLAFSPQTYDLIVSQPAEPWVNGAGDLYTKEFFKLVSARLSDKGVFCQWLQLYAIDEKTLLVLLNTMQSVFPSTYVFHPHGAGEILIVCFPSKSFDQKQYGQQMRAIGEDAKLDLERIKLAMAETALAAKLHYCHIMSSADLLSMLVLTPQSLDELLWKKLGTERILFNTDDNLVSEYSLPYQLLGKDDRIEKNLELLHSSRSNLLSCLQSDAGDAQKRAEYIDRVALSMAGFSQKHPGEGLDDAALAAAYEAWTLCQSPATAAACDVVAYMTGRFATDTELDKTPSAIDSLTPAQCFWVGQALALKGQREKAKEVFSRGIQADGPQKQELSELLKKWGGKN